MLRQVPALATGIRGTVLATSAFTGDVPVTKRLQEAALDSSRIRGYTHNFYRYPARFSPKFAAAAIECFSSPGDRVLDPYMGGATTIIEAMVAGRIGIGSDINELALFVALAKTTRLSETEKKQISIWASHIVPSLKCNLPADSAYIPRNMKLPNTRWLRKTISLLLDSIDTKLATESSRRFCRCVVLNVGQWALNGRKKIPTANELRERVVTTAFEMLVAASHTDEAIDSSQYPVHQPILRKNDAEFIDDDTVINDMAPVDLVVTSPPYPGIHLLYHRWQVDGRKETDAPYWIAACKDGAGSAYYNFADRRRAAEEEYFLKAVNSFTAVRNVMKPGAYMVQMVAFSDRNRQLQKYLTIMQRAGFVEKRDGGKARTWRDVPGRRWHASSKGSISSAREVVLIHQAV